MLFQTTPAHEELRAKIRAFAEEEIKPLAFLLDQNNEFPDEAVQKMGQLGWLGLPFPKEYGGAGLDILSYAMAVEELARVDGGAGVILSAHVSLGAWPIFAYGTEEQKQKYLVPLAKRTREMRHPLPANGVTAKAGRGIPRRESAPAADRRSNSKRRSDPTNVT